MIINIYYLSEPDIAGHNLVDFILRKAEKVFTFLMFKLCALDGV